MKLKQRNGVGMDALEALLPRPDFASQAEASTACHRPAVTDQPSANGAYAKVTMDSNRPIGDI
jgi:hypothetical protein